MLNETFKCATEMSTTGDKDVHYFLNRYFASEIPVKDLNGTL